MRRATLILGLLLMGMNLSLWAHGLIDNQDITNAYSDLPSGLQDVNSLDQNNLVLTDTNNTAVTSDIGGNIIAGILDFIESVPLLGSLVTAFRFAFNFVINITFGITFVAQELKLPLNYIVFIGALNFGIVTLGLLELMLDLTASRGGTR